MLKSLPYVHFPNGVSIDTAIGLTDELLNYAYETERTDPNLTSSLVEVLDEVDRVNTYHARARGLPWTHARTTDASDGNTMYREEDHYNFLAVTVQARLVKYVRAKLDANPNSARKDGRPLLDFALQPRRPIDILYHSNRDALTVNVDSKLRPYEVHVRRTLTLYHHLCSGTATPRTWGGSKPVYSFGRQQVSLAALCAFNGRERVMCSSGWYKGFSRSHERLVPELRTAHSTRCPKIFPF